MGFSFAAGGPCAITCVVAPLRSSHWFNLSATSSYLRDIAVTAPQQTIYI